MAQLYTQAISAGSTPVLPPERSASRACTAPPLDLGDGIYSPLLFFILQVVIIIDPSDKEQVDYWQRHNPEAFSMVDSGADKLGGRCADFQRVA